MRKNVALTVTWSLLVSGVVFGDDASDAAKRKTILERASAVSAKLDKQEAEAEAAYDAVETDLKKAQEAMRLKHAAKRVEQELAIATLEKDFGSNLEKITVAKKAVEANHAKKVAALDEELKALQERARTAYTDEVSADFKKHDEKRKTTEAERRKLLEEAEMSRLRSIEAYLSTVSRTQDVHLKELKALDAERAALVVAQDKQRLEARALLAKSLAAIRAARQDAQVTLSTELFQAVQVPGKTAPPVGAERHDLVDLAWERIDAAGGARLEVFVAGKVLADDERGKAIRTAFGRAIQPSKEIVTSDGLDETLRSIGFDAAGTMQLDGKSLEVKFSYPVDELQMQVPATVGKALEQRIARAVVAAHDRLPWEDFKLNGERVYFRLADARGVALPVQDKASIDTVKKIAAARKGSDLAGVDTKNIQLRWETIVDGNYVALNPQDAASMAARWARHVDRVTGGGFIPQDVRDRLTASAVAVESGNLQRPLALHADSTCSDYRFYRQGRELVVVDAAKKAVLFRVEGVYQLTRVACGPKGGLAFAGTKIHFIAPIERNWTKKLENELKPAEVIDDATTTSLKDGAEALFVFAEGKMTLALSPTLGRFGAVRFHKEGYRVWFWDREEKQLVGEFTLHVQADGKAAGPDAGAVPGKALLALEAPATTANVPPAPMPKNGNKK